MIGVTFGTSLVVLLTAGISLAGTDPVRLPSSWILSGSRSALAQALHNVLGGLSDGLWLLFFAFFCKVFFKRAWLAVLFIIPVEFAFERLTPLTPVAVVPIIITVGLAMVYLLLHTGLLSVMVAFYTFRTLATLTLTSDLSAPATGASILLLCLIAALALFGFHSTMAGRPLFKVEW